MDNNLDQSLFSRLLPLQRDYNTPPAGMVSMLTEIDALWSTPDRSVNSKQATQESV